jgi:hypothetical protein
MYNPLQRTQNLAHKVKLLLAVTGTAVSRPFLLWHLISENDLISEDK